MPFFDARMRRFALTIGVPAFLILLATFAVVIVSIEKMADEVDRIEDRVTERSAKAAVQTLLRRLGETNHDYAVWDEAVYNLYGEVNRAWADDTIVASTIDPVLFDTAYVIDENGNAVVACRLGEQISLTPTEAFGAPLAAMIAELPNDGTTYAVRTGIVRGAWGLAAFAVGPLVPISPDFENPPERSRYIVMGKALDDAAVSRLSEDFLIDGLRLVDPAASEPLKIDIADPNGTVIGALAWAPGRMGSVARAGVNPAVLTMLALVGVTMAFLIVLALRGWREVQTRELRLDAALNNMAQGLCMFDAERRLVTSNRRFAELFRLPPDVLVHGTPLARIMQLALVVDRDPEASLVAQRRMLTDPTSGATT